jgi:predicted NBD/HSP70 family sugar kinase
MTETKAVPALLRDLNERAVLETIRAVAPVSRAEVARRTGISKPTVSLVLRALLGAGLVRETSHSPGRPHYGAVYYEDVPEAALVLGLDLGARFVRGALCDLRGDVRARQDVRTGADLAAVLDSAAALRDALLRASGLGAELLERAVVGVPAVVPAGDGRVALAGDVPGLGEADLRAALEERLEVRVALENDVNLAALGERWRGVARGFDDFAFLSVGTGLGAAVVLDGRLYRGVNGAAGELDAVRAGRSDDVDPCAGALGAYAARLEPTRAPVEMRSLFAAARAGDRLGLAVAAEAARRIALHVVPIAATLDVPLLVLGGGIGANGDLLLGPVRKLLSDWLPFPPRVETSSLGDAAVLSGALATGRLEALESVLARRARARG